MTASDGRSTQDENEAVAAEAKALLASGRHADAAILLSRALARPSHPFPDHYGLLAEALDALGRGEEAADVRNELGTLLLRRRRFDEALAVFDGILARLPRHLPAQANRGAALSGLGRQDEAIALLAALAEAEPVPDVLNELGNALLADGRIDEAAKVLTGAVALKPDHAMALNNLAVAAERQAALMQDAEAVQRLDDAVAGYRRARARAPDAAIIHWNLALVLLAQGAYREGWAEYEWRWRLEGFGEPERGFAQPVWRGESPEALGGALLVTMEQGFGDAIHFARYVPLLVAQGHRVILEVAQELLALFCRSFEHLGARVIARAEDPHRVEGDPAFAAHVSLMSLPHRFGTTLDAIPSRIPYLAADPARIAHWRVRLPQGFRVGLVWAGRPQHHNDRNRSLPFTALAPLLETPDVAFVSLQKPGATEAAAADTALLRIGAELADFAETAAAIGALDLVIAVDTSVAHLAGALGKPCWVLLPAICDWRWLRGCQDSPWYPSLRLYRQQSLGDWRPVVARVARDLHALIKER